MQRKLLKLWALPGKFQAKIQRLPRLRETLEQLITYYVRVNKVVEARFVN